MAGNLSGQIEVEEEHAHLPRAEANRTRKGIDVDGMRPKSRENPRTLAVGGRTLRVESAGILGLNL